MDAGAILPERIVDLQRLYCAFFLEIPRLSDIPVPSRQLLADARRLRELQGLRFNVVLDGVEREAFAVRWKGRVHAWLNVCRHQLLPLDFGDAQFFDGDADALVCCHHGARYRPDTGECMAGPCAGARLTPLAVEERDGALWLSPPS